MRSLVPPRNDSAYEARRRPLARSVPERVEVGVGGAGEMGEVSESRRFVMLVGVEEEPREEEDRMEARRLGGGVGWPLVGDATRGERVALAPPKGRGGGVLSELDEA